jgi:hypothetical protein
MSDPLDRLARRVADDSFFLSSVLTAYQDRHGLDDAALAAQLGITPTGLTKLRLCRRPGAEPSRSAEDDIGDIARHFGIDPAKLRQVVNDWQ